ncbi:MAG: hypothetical protein WCG02_01490 [Candidatus Taylorbacteria bacterium]
MTTQLPLPLFHVNHLINCEKRDTIGDWARWVTETLAVIESAPTIKPVGKKPEVFLEEQCRGYEESIEDERRRWGRRGW